MNEQAEISEHARKCARFLGYVETGGTALAIQNAINESTAPLKAEIEQLRSIAMGVNMDELHRLQQHVKVLRDAAEKLLGSSYSEIQLEETWISLEKAMELTNPNP